jgi:putative ABC transport system permease protein
MSPPRTHRFLGLIRRPAIGEQVAAEVDFHIEMRARELVDGGMDPAAARIEALRRFGSLDDVSAECREIGTDREKTVRRTEFLSELRQDAAFAVRQLIKSPAFTIVAVVTLALGIGSTTAIFSAVRSVVLRSFPYTHPERVLMVSEYWSGMDGNVSDGNFTDWYNAARSFEAFAAERFTNFNVADRNSTERVSGGRVTHEFFRVFGARALLGRTFVAEEDQPGREQVAVLSHGFWTSRFAADRGVIGRQIQLSGRPYTVIGVMPASFDPTLSGEALWVPMAWTAERKAFHDEHHNIAVALLKPGVTREQANAELATIARAVEQRHPKDNAGRSARARSLPEVLVGDFRQRLLVTLGAVSFVLLIACGNVANLLLVRSAARRKEIALRAALGAGRGRIVRQLLTESAVLGVTGAAAGLALAWLGVRALVASAPPGIPRLEQTRIDPIVLAFALGLALLCSLVFGLAPALRAARGNVQSTLREGGRGMGTARDALRTGLVVAEVTLAFTLLVGAGLLVRSALYLQNVNPGFDPNGVIAARVALPQATYGEPAHAARAFRQIAERLQAAPGVRAAAIVSQAPLGPGGGSNGLIPEGRPIEPQSAINSRLRIITPGYFATMGVQVKRGRTFTDRDMAGAPRVMIVSEEVARQAWPGQDPIGKRVICCEGAPDDPRWKTVVGVAADVRSRGPTVAVAPEFYLPIDQVPAEAWSWTQRAMAIVARSAAGDAASLAAPLRAAVRDVDPSLPVYGLTTMNDALQSSVAQARFNTLLLTLLGVIGLILAAVGIYGVVAYFVNLRTHEIGVRVALGAQPRDVIRLMTWQGTRPVLIGMAIGTLTAIATTRLLQNSVYGVSVTDPVTMLAVAGALGLVGLLATVIPARRATRVDPVRALSSA